MSIKILKTHLNIFSVDTDNTLNPLTFLPNNFESVLVFFSTVVIFFLLYIFSVISMARWEGGWGKHLPSQPSLSEHYNFQICTHVLNFIRLHVS